MFSSELFMTADLGIVVQLCNCFLCSVLNCVRLLTRVLPYIFEDPDWRGFFWSTLPGQSQDEASVQSMPLAQSLITAICVRYIYCFKETENFLSVLYLNSVFQKVLYGVLVGWFLLDAGQSWLCITREKHFITLTIFCT